MKLPTPILRIFSILFLCSLISCSSSDGIDDYFTFNDVSSHDVSLDNALFQNQPVTVPISILIDSTVLAKNGTTVSLLRSMKLNQLNLVSTTASYPFSNIDTLTLSIQSDSMAPEILATYGALSYKVSYTNVDYIHYYKDANPRFILSMSTSNPPTEQFSFTVNITNVLTARPSED